MASKGNPRSPAVKVKR